MEVAIEALLSTWRHLSTEVKKLNREVERAARANPACRRLMTVPGVGCLTSAFGVRLREECLNLSWFQNLFDARRKISAWRTEYNEQRPHSSLGYKTPSQFAREQDATDFDKAGGGARGLKRRPLAPHPHPRSKRGWSYHQLSYSEMRGVRGKVIFIGNHLRD